MNERIREFAEQCVGSRPYNTFDYEKFAELIVRECAGVELYWLSEQDRKAVAGKIKEHFGVEE
jgi:NMD protein affecting ribosome stability and mRNA decay